MNENFLIAGNGMRKMFVAQIISLVAAGAVLLVALLALVAGGMGSAGLIVIVGLAAFVAIIVSAIMSLMGLYSAGPAHANFKTAFTVTIINIVVNIIGSFFKEGLLAGLFDVANVVLGFLVVYFVCTAASELLTQKGDDYQADRGTLIWKMYFVCTAIAVVCSILAVIPIIGALAAIVSVISSIVELVASILYLVFLYKASESLLA